LKEKLIGPDREGLGLGLGIIIIIIIIVLFAQRQYVLKKTSVALDRVRVRFKSPI